MKILGLILIFAAPSTLGFLMSAKVKEELDQIGAFIDLIGYIKYEISLFLTKQDEIFEKFSNDTLEKCGFLEKLRSSPLDGEHSMLYRALCERDDTLLLDEETLKILKGFAENFGRLALDEQVEKCDTYIKILREIYNSKKADVISKVKLYRNVGLISGMGLVLTLI